MDFEHAIEMLHYPDTWPEATQALIAVGDRQAFVPLLQAYEMADEEEDCECLLEAMEELDPVIGARELVAAGDAETWRLGLHLMELFPDAAHFPLLEEGIQSQSTVIRRQAARSILCQRPNATWERLLLCMLTDEDPHLRLLAVEGLQYLDSRPVQQALHDQLDQETDHEIQQALQNALAGV